MVTRVTAPQARQKSTGIRPPDQRMSRVDTAFLRMDSDTNLMQIIGVAQLATERLDRRHPLWKFHLIEDYTGPDGVRGSALILRIHHRIADGIALLSVIMPMADGGAPPPGPQQQG